VSGAACEKGSIAYCVSSLAICPKTGAIVTLTHGASEQPRMGSAVCISACAVPGSQATKLAFARSEVARRRFAQYYTRMARPDGVDLPFFFAELDKRSELAGARVVYFDGGIMSVLRQGPPICQSGLLGVVIRKGGKSLLPTSSEIAQARDERFNAELLNLGLSCGGVLVAWVVSATSTGAAPITGGLSMIIASVSAAAGAASYAQCVMAGARMYNEYVDPNANVEMDDERWYQWFSAISDGVSLAGSAITGVQTLKLVRLLKNSTRKGALEVLKGLSRQERKKLTEELIRANNPGMSDQEIKVLLSRNILPKNMQRRFSNDAIGTAIRKQLLDSVNAGMGVVGSSTSGLISQAGPPGKIGDLLFGIVNAYDTM
jgi:hypothetical protein